MLFFSNFNELHSVLKLIFIKAAINSVKSAYNTVSGNLNIKNMPHSSPNKFKCFNMKYYKHIQCNRIETVPNI